MLIKVCGITRVEDAAAAVAAGAGAIGFIFWPKSPRFVDPFRAKKIAASLPPFVTPVGVFVNQPAEYVRGVTRLVRLGAVQLHGDETIEYASGIGAPIIKALKIGDTRMDAWPASTMVLLDADDPVRRGGTRGGRSIGRPRPMWPRGARFSSPAG